MQTIKIVLPTGQVLFTHQTTDVNIYTPLGTPNAAWAPTITSVPSSLSLGSTYTISGTQFNGLTQGAYYGDDRQSATNYPLVRITNNATSHVFYARTHGHSSMGVATGSGRSYGELFIQDFMAPRNSVVTWACIAQRFMGKGS